MKSFKKVKTLVFILAILGTASIFSSCKKGEDDPTISLRSRDKRLEGEWKLVKLETKEVRINGTTTTTTTESLNGSDKVLSETIATPTGSTTTTNTDTYTMDLSIKKGGEFASTEIENGTTMISSGHWAWGSDNKNKSQILFTNDISQITLNGSVFDILRLANKELVLVQKTMTQAAPDDSFEYTATLTFEIK